MFKTKLNGVKIDLNGTRSVNEEEISRPAIIASEDPISRESCFTFYVRFALNTSQTSREVFLKTIPLLLSHTSFNILKFHFHTSKFLDWHGR